MIVVVEGTKGFELLIEGAYVSTRIGMGVSLSLEFDWLHRATHDPAGRETDAPDAVSTL